MSKLQRWLAGSPDGPPVYRLVVAGLLIVGIGIGGFFLWAGLAPLASGAIARGIVASETARKTVQHLDGGIIDEIVVAEGETVEAGAVLVKLDPVDAKARYDLLATQELSLLAQAARLNALRKKEPVLSFPPQLTARSDEPDVAEIMDAQRRIFETQRSAQEGQIGILSQQVEQQRSLIAAYEARIASSERQLDLIREELEGVQALVDKGLERRPRLLALEREAASLEGEQSEFRERIAGALESIAEAEIRIATLTEQRANETAQELRDVQLQLAEVSEKMKSARAQLDRREIRAPQTGTVMNLRYVTTGGVIPPGGAVLDIVPADEKLTIDVRISPQDIDVVRAGLPARVRLTAFRQRFMPVLDGEVVRVSADAFRDDRTGEGYFSARVEIPASALEALPEVELYPGMPAETVIVTGERSVLNYLMAPLSDSFFRAFREQ